MTQLSGNAVTSRRDQRQKYLWIGSTVFDVVLDGDQTGGALAVLDQRCGQGDATPMHVHRSEAEVLYLISGTITAWAGEDASTLEEGAAVFLPPARPHAFRVESETARLLTVTTPAGFASFVRAAGMPVDTVPQTWEFDLGRVMAAAGQHDIDIVGPPPV